jgi:hypothetical protein
VLRHEQSEPLSPQTPWLTIRRRPELVTVSAVIILVLVGFLAYWPLLEFTFFWEDPLDIGQVDERSFYDLFRRATNDLFYRPLLLAMVKLLGGRSPSYDPLPFYLLNIVTRVGAALLLYGAVTRWFRDRLTGFLSALLFLLCPISFDSTAKAMSAHQPLLPLALGALWLYTVGRESGRRWAIGLAIALSTVGFLIHENAVLLPFLVLALEAYLWFERRVDRFSPIAFSFLAPVLILVAVWLAVPKPGGTALRVGSLLDKALYLSQSLTFPVAGLISQTGGWGLGARAQAGLAVVLSLAALALCYGPRRWSRLLLILVWWCVASGLPWMALPMGYLETSSRLLYFPSFIGALAWGGVIAVGERTRRSALKGLIILGLVVQSWVTVQGLTELYGAGSDLMAQVVSAARSNKRTLFVNVPDRFAYRVPTYPMGFWGMMLAPVSQDLSDFVELTARADVETVSLSDFILLASAVPDTPYEVHTRGSDAHATERLYDAALWADQTYLASYHADGSIALRAVGDIQPTRTTAGLLGQYDGTAELLSADVDVREEQIVVELRWASLQPPRPMDTVFLHLVDGSGEIVAQADGDSLGHLVAPSAWRPGHEVVDRRFVPLPASTTAGRYRLRLGMYNLSDGGRYEARAFGAEPMGREALEIWRGTLTP